uniref:Uncharacterized protein n=1 Tax=Romanomermis culicivorax TaxID=13658 RepID=A0A915JQM2_ROMCU
MEKKRKR